MKKRIWGSLLLAGLVLLSSRSAVAETTRQESIRILFEALAEQEKSGASLSAEEAAARSQCIDPSCAHVSVDEEGNVTALCPYGQYLLSANPYMVFSANPVTELELQPGTNTLYRSGTYHVTGGDGFDSLIVTKGRAVSLLLDGALLARLQRSDGSAACRGRARAMTSAARICTPHSSTPARRLPKQPSPATPRINAGPQLLENSSRRQASRREMPPRRYSWATVRAPTG